MFLCPYLCDILVKGHPVYFYGYCDTKPPLLHYIGKFSKVVTLHNRQNSPYSPVGNLYEDIPINEQFLSVLHCLDDNMSRASCSVNELLVKILLIFEIFDFAALSRSDIASFRFVSLYVT
jgi:hypothetical protein